ncbi:uncharacterized protein LOC123660824 [Melitaea cinxia]|uniref:uncharacterized protein LOC123660824 n=1 Tax=Melitaea cinxia TaxID=113334 RepID=UPI001E27179A|nr:uncharacterized protein LOC123660824 [Melitaea cinxia]
MKCEIPEYARCCCCFPLRYGLLVWAYTKLVLIGIILFQYFDLIITAIASERISSHNVALFVLIFIITIFYCVDFVFHIIFIISAHKKSTAMMKLFYKEAIVGLIFYVFCFFYFLVFYLTKFSFMYLYLELGLWCLFVLVIIAHGYLILLVRSEVRKLERNSNFQFTNTAQTEEQNMKADAGVIA